jgi:hypothetical protein
MEDRWKMGRRMEDKRTLSDADVSMSARLKVDVDGFFSA